MPRPTSDTHACPDDCISFSTLHFAPVVRGLIAMIAVVVPAHNEARHIGRCILSLRKAADCPGLRGEPVSFYVVADACNDSTAQKAADCGAQVIETCMRNVGAARAMGADAALADGARWLAFTDADTQVAPDWLAQQLAQASDAVCGTIEVRDWRSWGPLQRAMRSHFAHTYCDEDGHRHIHGANLGVSAEAYRHAGGFAALASSEDVALVQALEAMVRTLPGAQRRV